MDTSKFDTALDRIRQTVNWTHGEQCELQPSDALTLTGLVLELESGGRVFHVGKTVVVNRPAAKLTLSEKGVLKVVFRDRKRNLTDRITDAVVRIEEQGEEATVCAIARKISVKADKVRDTLLDMGWTNLAGRMR